MGFISRAFVGFEVGWLNSTGRRYRTFTATAAVKRLTSAMAMEAAARFTAFVAIQAHQCTDKE